MACKYIMCFCRCTADKSGVLLQQSAYGAYGAGYSQQGSGVSHPLSLYSNKALHCGVEHLCG